MNALSISNLQKTYPNGMCALKGIDLEVRQGDFFALLGPNGAGKSTAIGIMTSLLNKSAGKIKVFDYDLDKDIEQVKSSIGLVPQEFNFNLFTPLDEILINQAGYYGVPRKKAIAKAAILLKKLGLWEKRSVMSRELSGGMKRRLMICRALMHDPKLLILDEPTAGVDIELRRSMWEFLEELNEQGTTIILTTHYLEEAEAMCRNIAIIDQGEIVHNSSMADLLGQLQTATFVLSLKKPLEKLPELMGFQTVLTDNLHIEVEVHHSQTLNQLFKALSAHGLEVVSLRNKQNRLEQLFLDLVKSRKDLSDV